jgi:hypothetical protein
MNKKLYLQYGKQHGPGGIYCPCCNHYRCHPKNSKHLERRQIRRKMKQELKQYDMNTE